MAQGRAFASCTTNQRNHVVGRNEETAMNFEPDPTDERFREEVRAFLRSELPADMAKRGRSGFLSARDDALTWQKILANKGWSVPHWPVEYGGPRWTARQRYIFDEECYLAG